MYRWDIINHFIEKKGYKSYLEIGYYKGWSFDRVNAETKIAVDPNPSKDAFQEKLAYGALIETDNNVLIKLTSDDFFKEYSNKYDIIFIDGLHESEQVFKDILNSLKHLNEGGTILLHDCNPPLYEHTTTGIDGCWTGDTYKAILKFRALYPYEFYTVDTDWGVGIIGEQLSPPIISPCTGAENWKTFSENRQALLNLISIDEFKTKINDLINSSTQ